ncbi:GNAT family N-acetyltransferase [Bosea sp. 124]|uniref:GNAT family N-acetyltransferase n=1 Tax=Bosea sp. 124 TaxID=2135642 RepID=UPI000D349C26|nr:GNAT family N-acetyltransferase [Bosea sp. 124]PTM42167.1 acetyltransferase (GNAT) family protein [Bosea sp. 124]
MNTGIVVRRIRPADYAGYGPAFAELAARALEPNPHMSPAAAAAARVVVPEDRIVILAAWLSEALGSERLAGIWALRRQRDWRSGFAPALVAPILPLYEVSSLPVIDRDRADDVMQALFRHLLAAGDLPRTLALPLLALEGPSFAALTEACRVTGSRLSTYERWQRPVMRPEPGDDAERYLRRALGQSYKKRMQQFRAIGRHGEMSFRRLRGSAARDAFSGFLALEAAGWKGQAGTAIARLPQASAYFDTLVALFADADALQIDMLLLDGHPLAMGLLVESAGTRHFLKIAYDESQARHSPGRALTIAMLQADFAATPPAFFDSGAGDGVDAGTYVWGERRAMGNAIIGLGGGAPDMPRLAASLRRGLRRLRAQLQR